MNTNPISLPTISTNNGPMVDFGVRRRKTDRPGYGELGQKPADLLRIAVIGYGYWGPNVVRNLHSLDNCDVVAVCDKSQAALKTASRTYPGIQLTTEFADVLTSAYIDAVAIVTPVWTHFALAKAALENGKHVFLDKPLTSTTEPAELLVDRRDRGVGRN